MVDLLPVSVFLPLIGCVLICALGRQGHETARRIALVTAVITLFPVGRLVLDYPDRPAEFDFAWFTNSAIDIRFSLGIDGLGVWMFGLTALLSITAILVSWEAIKDRAHAFYAL